MIGKGQVFHNDMLTIQFPREGVFFERGAAQRFFYILQQLKETNKKNATTNLKTAHQTNELQLLEAKIQVRYSPVV